MITRNCYKIKSICAGCIRVTASCRQATISKWDKGISGPDADLLMQAAEILGVSVGELLGADIDREGSENGIAEKLAHINEQLAIRNRRSRRIWRSIAAIFVAILVINQVIAIAGITTYRTNGDVEIETRIVSTGE